MLHVSQVSVVGAQQAIAGARAAYAPPGHSVFDLVEPEFRLILDHAYGDMGRPLVNIESCWNVFVRLKQRVRVFMEADPFRWSVVIAEGDRGQFREFRGQPMAVRDWADIRRPYWRQLPAEAAELDDHQYDDSEDDDHQPREDLSDSDYAEDGEQYLGGGVILTDISEPNSLAGLLAMDQVLGDEDDFEEQSADDDEPSATSSEFVSQSD